MKIFYNKLSIWWSPFKVCWYLILSFDNILLFFPSFSSFLLFFLNLALLFPILLHFMLEKRLVIMLLFFKRRLTILFYHLVYNRWWLVVIFVKLMKRVNLFVVLSKMWMVLISGYLFQVQMKVESVLLAYRYGWLLLFIILRA